MKYHFIIVCAALALTVHPLNSQNVFLGDYGKIVTDKPVPERVAAYTPYKEAFKIEYEGIEMFGNGLYTFQNGYITIESYEAAIPSTIRIYDRSGRLKFSESFPQTINPVLSNNGKFSSFFDGKNVVVIDLDNFSYTSIPGGVIFGVDDQGIPVYFDSEKSSVRYGTDTVHSDHHALKFLFFNGDLVVLDRKGASIVRDDALQTIREFRGTFFDGSVSDGTLYVVDRVIENTRHVYRLYKTSNGSEFVLIDTKDRVIKEIPPVNIESGEHSGSGTPIRSPLRYAEDDVAIAVSGSYGQIQEYGGAPYLHPGIDLMGDNYESVYAVKDGVVKAVLTIGNHLYWRVAISNTFTDEHSYGYLYAHLDPGQIFVQVGDTVQAGEVIGNLVPWPSYDLTHLHFARIEHSGAVWEGNWWTSNNPQVSITNIVDTSPPVFENALGDDLFAFRTLNGKYLKPDSLYGKIDIISKVYDLTNSDWKIDVWSVKYRIFPVGEPGSPVVDQLAFRFDFPLDTYHSREYDNLVLHTIYSMDDVLRSTGNYTEFKYFHIITNSRGTGHIGEQDRYQYLDTSELPAGEYMIEITATDVALNSSTDSMTVTIVPTPTDTTVTVLKPDEFTLYQNYPNPFNTSTMIRYGLPDRTHVNLSVYNSLGQHIELLVNEALEPGVYEVQFDASYLPTGFYIYRLQAGDYMESRKLLFIK